MENPHHFQFEGLEERLTEVSQDKESAQKYSGGGNILTARNLPFLAGFFKASPSGLF